mmetsp:Transcript_5576/g.21099  ORF Transcript_5576/g.21099 Transcript_5576/m.21099 type:complete len:281 (+) Transcript_5576:1794-2636(+)
MATRWRRLFGLNSSHPRTRAVRTRLRRPRKRHRGRRHSGLTTRRWCRTRSRTTRGAKATPPRGRRKREAPPRRWHTDAGFRFRFFRFCFRGYFQRFPLNMPSSPRPSPRAAASNQRSLSFCRWLTKSHARFPKQNPALHQPPRRSRPPRRRRRGRFRVRRGIPKRLARKKPRLGYLETPGRWRRAARRLKCRNQTTPRLSPDEARTCTRTRRAKKPPARRYLSAAEPPRRPSRFSDRTPRPEELRPPFVSCSARESPLPEPPRHPPPRTKSRLPSSYAFQ